MSRVRHQHVRLTTKGQIPKRPEWLAKKRVSTKRRYRIEGASGFNSYLLWNVYDPLNHHRATTAPDRTPARPLGLGLTAGGMSKKTFDRKMLTAKREAKRIARYMTEKKQFVPDNETSGQMLEALVAIVRGPASNADKIKAAGKVLDIVQKKPVAASEMTLNNAESFLDAILAEEKQERDAKRASRNSEETEG